MTALTSSVAHEQRRGTSAAALMDMLNAMTTAEASEPSVSLVNALADQIQLRLEWRDQAIAYVSELVEAGELSKAAQHSAYFVSAYNREIAHLVNRPHGKAALSLVRQRRAKR